MFKKPSRKQFIIQRITLMIVATIAVVLIVTVAVLFMLGYRLDSGNGKLEQGALLQFDSTPNNAQVSVDGLVMGSATPTKQTVIAGTHTVTMTKTGYEPWARTLKLDAGTLTWLDYTRLVPKTRPVTTVTTYSELSGLLISPDLKWAVAHEKADSPSFQLIDLRSENVTTATLTLPATLYSEATTADVTHTFTLYAWNNDGRYMLATHTYKDQTEWLMLDTQDISKSVNITRMLSVSFQDIQFAGTSGTSLFGLTSDRVVRKLDLSAGTISRSLITGVSRFTVFDANIISYVGAHSTNSDWRVAGVYRDGEESAHVLRTVQNTSEPLFITTGRYYDDDYVAIAQGKAVTLLSGSYPSPGASDTASLSVATTLDAPSDITALSFSAKGDYLVAQSGAQFVSYEIEHQRVATASVSVADTSSARTLHWLDAAHLWNDDDGTLVMRDFNGINAQTIMKVESGFDASLSQNGRFLYAVGKDDKGYHLQRVKMILD